MILFRNFRMLDPEREELAGGCELLVEGETIREVSEKPIRPTGATAIDCGGRTLMPGLIDCHAHVVLSEVFLRQPRADNAVVIGATARRHAPRCLKHRGTRPRHPLHHHQPQRIAGHIDSVAQGIGAEQ